MSDHPVITSEEARKITGGRTPLVPVQYDRAIAALKECREIDEAKTWSDRADVLAAWAKIYHSGEADRQARLLKLHAFRRMGELAAELRSKRPQKIVDDGRMNGGKRATCLPGARALLIESGLKPHDAQAALRLSDLPQERFQQFEVQPKIPTPIGATKHKSEIMRVAAELSAVACHMRQISPGVFLKDPPSRSQWRENAEEVYDWLAVVLQKRPK